MDYDIDELQANFEEFSSMICVDITPLNDVVERIDNALHHPEMYMN